MRPASDGATAVGRVGVLIMSLEPTGVAGNFGPPGPRKAERRRARAVLSLAAFFVLFQAVSGFASSPFAGRDATEPSTSPSPIAVETSSGLLQIIPPQAFPAERASFASTPAAGAVAPRPEAARTAPEHPRRTMGELLWERLRVPLFLFLLLGVFIALLVISLRRPGPTRWRALTSRSLVLSLIIHLVILMILDSWVVSYRIIQTIRDAKFEIVIDSDNLAEEKVSLGIREESERMPLADSAVALAPRFAELPVPELPPVERKPVIVPGKVEQPILEVPKDLVAQEKPVPERQVVATLAARPVGEFRISPPRLSLEAPKVKEPEKPKEPSVPEAAPPLAKREFPVQPPPRLDRPKVNLPPSDLVPLFKSSPAESPLPPPATPRLPERAVSARPLPQKFSVVMMPPRLEVAKLPATEEKPRRLRPPSALPPREKTPSAIESSIVAPPAQAPPLPPGAPAPSPTATLPAPVGLPKEISARPTVPRRALVPSPMPRPVPPPFTLEERPFVEEPYRLRRPEARAKVLEKMGGSRETEEAVKMALAWLAAHQSDDGRWDIDGFDAKCGKCGGPGSASAEDVAATAMSLLAFLGAGHTHKDEGPYRETVARGLKWLRSQARDNGNLMGRGTMYDQGMATIALAEAYGMTHDVSLRPLIERAVRFIVAAQNKQTGGWRYFPGEMGDTSVFGWELMALKSARINGIEVPERAFDLARRWLKRVGGGRHGGLCGYQSKRVASPAMVAEGMFSHLLLGRKPDDPIVVEASEYLIEHLPAKSAPNFYYWYYGTLALFQQQGPAWKSWNRAMRKALLSTQEKSGAPKGSWEPRGEWAKEGGRVVQTAFATLCLEVYYRYLPLYAPLSGTEAAAAGKGSRRTVAGTGGRGAPKK